MGVKSRSAIYLAAALTCTAATGSATAACVIFNADVKWYLMVGLYSLIAHAWVMAGWLVKPDHQLLALARTKIQLARLNNALREEEDLRARSNVTSMFG
jgi:hypothetical protein